MRVKTLLLLIMASLPAQLQAFEFDGSKWPGAETEFYALLPGIAFEGSQWTTAVISALEEWNSVTPFNFVVREAYRNPCLIDFINSIDFTDNVCGSTFGASTIAVTLREFEPAFLGPPDISSADIVINQAKSFDVYDGPLSPLVLGSRLNPIDLRRVVLHELGHVIGLGHDDQNPAIMNTTIGDIDRLQQDDIDGAGALYGGLNNCEVIPVFFGTRSDALQTGDCTVKELMVGGEDLSHIDVYRLTLSESTNLTLQAHSDSLDSVILLADDKLRIFDLDDNSGGDCDASLTRTLAAGIYYVLANTYDTVSSCGEIEGPYQLSLTFSAAGESDLVGGMSLLGGSSDAQFFGGISADDGDSFGNRFKADDALDISGRIEVDPRHHGLPGFLVMGALLDGEFLLKNLLGQWIDFNPETDSLIKAAEKLLEPVESISIAEELVLEAFGFDQISVDFYFGYGVDSEPGEFYFHQNPINLLVQPAPTVRL